MANAKDLFTWYTTMGIKWSENIQTKIHMEGFDAA